MTILHIETAGLLLAWVAVTTDLAPESKVRLSAAIAAVEDAAWMLAHPHAGSDGVALAGLRAALAQVSSLLAGTDELTARWTLKLAQCHLEDTLAELASDLPSRWASSPF